jgi:lipopolysaccharide/colanic/teichoic acid biosynthesis glycosyltransferase
MREDGSLGLAGTQARAVYQRVKCGAEAIVAILALVVLSPLLLIVALLVKLSSPGPVFFGDLREGKDGRVFRCWKFRSMRKDADKQQRALYETNQVDGPQFKMPSDPRITPIGAILRRTNIDELPQLFNVAIGQMSLIGPRPSPFRENQICVAWRRARLSVRPGITGLWQICRHNRAAGDFHQWILFDILYVRHLSPMLDVKILLATLATAGGRWSVPLSWLLSDQSRLPAVLDVPTRTPILAVVGGAPSEGQCIPT